MPFSIGKGSIAALEGAAREQEGARGARGSKREHYGAVCRGVAGGSTKWVPNLRLELPSIFSMP